jgi:hypothetical protein
MNEKSRKAIFAKGQIVKVKNGFNAGEVGQITQIEDNPRYDGKPYQVKSFVSIRTTGGKNIHGDINAFEKTTATKHDRLQLKWRGKLLK